LGVVTPSRGKGAGDLGYRYLMYGGGRGGRGGLSKKKSGEDKKGGNQKSMKRKRDVEEG